MAVSHSAWRAPGYLGHQIAGELHDDEPSDAASVEVRERLERAEQRAFELQDALAGAREELDAVRDINRELLAAHNRPGS
jgi:hypothetical protein